MGVGAGAESIAPPICVEAFEANPQTRLAKPTIIPEAKIAYPALKDSGA